MGLVIQGCILNLEYQTVPMDTDRPRVNSAMKCIFRWCLMVVVGNQLVLREYRYRQLMVPQRKATTPPPSRKSYSLIFCLR